MLSFNPSSTPSLGELQSAICKCLGIVAIGGASAFARIPFEMETIDPAPPDRPWYKMTGDINSDGKPDILIAGAKGPMVAYLNPDWEKIHLADGVWDGVGGRTGDIDGDGDIDIAMGGVVWFENPGKLDVSWPIHRVDAEKIHDVRLTDVNGDGRPDIVGRNQSAFRGDGNRIFIYKQGSNQSWKKEVLPCPHGEGIRVIDLDRDGDPDIVLPGLWYENTRNGDQWLEHRYTDQWEEEDAKVEVADLNRDGRPDILLAPAERKEEYYRVCWYEGPDRLTQSGWTEHEIIESIECVLHSLGVGDLDGDGDIDIAYAEMHQGVDPDEVCVLINGNGGHSWTKQVLSESGSHDILLRDLDNDGDLDILGANHAGPSPVELWRNQTVQHEDPAP